MKKFNLLILSLIPCFMLVANGVQADSWKHERGRSHVKHHAKHHGKGHNKHYRKGRDYHRDYGREHRRGERYDRDRIVLRMDFGRDRYHDYRRYERRYDYDRRYGRRGYYEHRPRHRHHRRHGGDRVFLNLNVGSGAGQCNREAVGQILGGVTGAYVGSRVAGRDDRLIGVAAGTVMGVILGGELGRSMDRADRYCVGQALEHAPDGSRITWNDGRQYYSVSPGNTRRYGDDRYCREYYMEAEIGGRVEQVYGHACRQPDGAWRISG